MKIRFHYKIILLGYFLDTFNAVEYNCLFNQTKRSWKLNKLFGVNFIQHDHIYLVENYFQVLNILPKKSVKFLVGFGAWLGITPTQGCININCFSCFTQKTAIKLE